MTQGRTDEHLETHLRGHRIAGQAEDRDAPLAVLVPTDGADTEDVPGPGGDTIETNGAKDGQDLTDRVP